MRQARRGSWSVSQSYQELGAALEHIRALEAPKEPTSQERPISGDSEKISADRGAESQRPVLGGTIGTLFAHLVGVAPIEASSGKITRYRLNRGGDRQGNRALYLREAGDPT